MFDVGLQEMLVIGVLALLVFGPSKLPELGRMVGRAMREFRRASEEFRSTVETNLNLNETDAPSPWTPTPTEGTTPVGGADTVARESLPSESEPAIDHVQPVAVSDEPGEPFCAQRGSRLFHRRECAWVRRIPEVDRIYFKRVADARDNGFATCPVCEPWEPA